MSLSVNWKHKHFGGKNKIVRDLNNGWVYLMPIRDGAIPIRMHVAQLEEHYEPDEEANEKDRQEEGTCTENGE